jgi:hypothetical protein
MHVVDHVRAELRVGLRATGRHARPLHGVLGWWAVTSFGLVSVLLAVLAALWPSSVRALGAAAVGSWLLFSALGRLGGTQVLRARYGGPLALHAGAALVALAGVIVVRQPGLDPAVGAAAASLALGVAAAGDAAVAAQLPRLARSCLWVRAVGGLVAAIAVAAAPVTGLIVAAACVGLAEITLAVRLLPEVERLAEMVRRGET